MHACNCQLFTDEGSRRLLKHLNYCFSVLASVTNRSTKRKLLGEVGIWWHMQHCARNPEQCMEGLRQTSSTDSEEDGKMHKPKEMVANDTGHSRAWKEEAISNTISTGPGHNRH